MTDVIQRNTGFRNTVLDCISRKSVVMLLSGKPFFLRRSENVTIQNNAGSRIMIKCRNTKNVIPYGFSSAVDMDNFVVYSVLKNSIDRISTQTAACC